MTRPDDDEARPAGGARPDGACGRPAEWDDDEDWPDRPWPWVGAGLEDPDDDWSDLWGPDDDLPPVPFEPLTTPAATLECLVSLVGPERTGPPAIWLLPVDAERRALPFVLPVAEVLEVADADVAAQLVGAVAPVVEAAAPGGGAIVVGLVRAAGGDRGAFEASWAQHLRDAADERGIEVHAVVAIGGARARVLEW
jgi:hypothetical protein